MKVALKIDTPALGDTLASIPTLRKISQAYDNIPITIFTSKPFLFDNHPLVKEALPLNSPTEGYKVYTTFSSLVGKNHNLNGENVEFLISNSSFNKREFQRLNNAEENVLPYFPLLDSPSTTGKHYNILKRNNKNRKFRLNPRNSHHLNNGIKY